MYAKIKFTKSILHTLWYNEAKLRHGKAEPLLAENFIKDLEDLTWDDKLYHFQRLNIMNQWAQSTLHISLNFHPSDNLSNTTMQNITREYMQGMKLSEQPYLAYRHYDSAHPHVHVVTTAIQPDGKKLILQLRHFYQSRQISKELEHRLNLTICGRGMAREERLRLNQAQKITYGLRPTMPALSHVINRVVPNYQYTTLEELNAVLRLYNVEAFRGKEDSHLYQHHGLIYRVLDDNGHAIRTPIKASLFDSKPTLDKLERQYILNQSQRQQHRQRLTVAIDWTLLKHSMDPGDFKKAMEKERISVVWEEDKSTQRQKIYYIDHQSRAVFEGRDLGERYTAEAIEERCHQQLTQKQEQTLKERLVLQEKQTETQRQTHRLRLSHHDL